MISGLWCECCAALGRQTVAVLVLRCAGPVGRRSVLSCVACAEVGLFALARDSRLSVRVESV